MTDHATINLRSIETKSYQNNIETNDTSNPKRIETMTRDVIIFSPISFYSALSFSWK